MTNSNTLFLSDCGARWPRLGIVMAAALVMCGCAKEPSAEERPPTLVDVSTVVQQTVIPQIEVTGVVEAIQSSNLPSGVAGKVLEYHFESGEFVAKDTVIAKLDTTSIEIEIARAQALAAEKKLLWDELKAGYRQDEVVRAKAEMEAAQVARDMWEERVARIREARDVLTADAVTEAEGQYQQAIHQFTAAEAEWKRLERDTKVQQSQTEQAYLALAEEVKRLEDQLAKHFVKAPYDGYLALKLTDVGEWLGESDAVCKLVRLNEVDVVASVEETSLRFARIGAVVDEIRFDALPGRTFNGVIMNKGVEGPGSHIFPVRIRVENTLTESEPDLRVGMFARLTIKGEPRTATLVPKDSITRATGTPTVYILMEDNRVRPVPIVEGAGHGEFMEVISGEILPNQTLVTDGVEALRAFQVVQIREPEDAVDDAADDGALGGAPRQDAQDGSLALSSTANR